MSTFLQKKNATNAKFVVGSPSPLSRSEGGLGGGFSGWGGEGFGWSDFGTAHGAVAWRPWEVR